MAQQTAVEWLEDNLIGNPFSEKDFAHNVNVFKQSKAMEKEQIINAHIEGWSDAYDYLADTSNNQARQAEDYYNETYHANKH